VYSMRDVEDLSLLQDRADMLMAAAGDAAIVPSISFTTPPPDMQLEQIGAGDTVHVAFDRGWIHVDDWFRVMNVTVDVAEPESETTTFQLAPASMIGAP
jgi:hypothetical protein